MKVLLFVLFAGYAVRCDDKNYYVIEMLEAPFIRANQPKPFKVYWNVPTKQCKSKKIPFDDLYEKFGIIQNENDAFIGEKVTILYDPGLFPALLKNETSGKFKFRNGGVPQEGDLNKHLKAFKDDVDQSIPDEDFDGLGIIDFESWRPVYRQNFGVLRPYQDVSLEIERKQHSWWHNKWLQAEAKRRFEEAARTFMQTTIALARQLRPRARWGFYGFPYCFNMASNNMVEACASNVPQENDEISWLWRESTALYPSVYSSVELSTRQMTSLIRGRVKEASRFGRRILPYFWYRYRDAGFLSEVDLDAALNTLYKSNASGFIIWGSSNDVNTVDKCTKLHNYIDQVMGPAVAKYTKSRKLQEETDDSINETTTDGSTTTIVNDVSNVATITSTTSDSPNRIKDLDPEYHWTPPENYTQAIKDHVEEEINKKLTNYTGSEENTVLDNNVLIDLILNSIINTSESSSISSTTVSDVESSKSKIENIDLTSEKMLSSTTTEGAKDLEFVYTSMISYADNDEDKKAELDLNTSTENVKLFEPTTSYDESYKEVTRTSFNEYDTTSISPVSFTSIIDDTSKSKNIKKISVQDSIEGFFDITTETPLTTESPESNSSEEGMISTEVSSGYSTENNLDLSTDKITTAVTKTQRIETTTLNLRLENDSKEITNPTETEILMTTDSIQKASNVTETDSSTTEPQLNIDDTAELTESTRSPILKENNEAMQANSKENIEDIDSSSTDLKANSETKEPNFRSIDNPSTKAPNLKENTEVTNEALFEDTSLMTTTTSPEQVSGSAQRISKSQTLYCIVFYIYSISKCLCSVFRQCS